MLFVSESGKMYQPQAFKNKVRERVIYCQMPRRDMQTE
jgi:hypothetical protein